MWYLEDQKNLFALVIAEQYKTDPDQGAVELPIITVPKPKFFQDGEDTYVSIECGLLKA